MYTTHLTMAIYDLGCWGRGALIVERALCKTRGVIWVYVSPVIEMAYVIYDAARTDPDHLLAAVEHAGFGAGDLHMWVARHTGGECITRIPQS